MLREISEEVRVTLKDRLRDARHMIRQHRHGGGHSPITSLGERLPLPRPPLPTREIDGLLGRAVSAFDDAMSLAEKLAPRPGHPESAQARSLAFYFADDRHAGKRAFRRDLYHLARQVLAGRRIADARIHEVGFASVHAAMHARHGALLAGLSDGLDWSQRISAASATCAALLVELLDHRPLRFDRPGLTPEEERTLEVLCLTPLVLACGFATVEPEAQPDPDLMELTILATDARLDRILPACRGANSQEDLTRLFAVLLAHLP